MVFFLLIPLAAAAVSAAGAAIAAEEQQNRERRERERQQREREEEEERLRRRREELASLERERARLEEEARQRRERDRRIREEYERREREERERQERERCARLQREREEREQRERKRQEEYERMERERQAQLRHMQEEQQRQREEAERRERERQAQLERERRAQQQRLQEERRRIEEAERRERERQAQLQAEIRRKEEAARAELQRRQEEIAREKAEQERMRAEMQRKAEEEQAELQRRHEEELKVQKEEQERKQAELKREEEEQKAIEELMRLKLEEGEQLILENARLITKGICPNLLPTEEEWEKARARLVGGKEKFHCAIAGTSGAGKSSLVNALRGISNRHANAAKVGVVETTTEITAYPDPSTTSARSQWVWYDVPGAGTLSIPGPQYFNSQGLFVFDLVIVVVDNRFTAQDIAILHQCKQFKIPSFIVRSKANQYISNIMHQELGYPMDETEEYTTEDTLTRDSRTETLEKSKQILITNTQENFKKNLEEAELDSSQRVYIVCAQSIRAVVTMEPGAQLKKADYLIDDMQLMEDLDKAVEKRS